MVGVKQAVLKPFDFVLRISYIYLSACLCYFFTAIKFYVMDEKAAKSLSKFMSYVLRHHPDLIGVSYDRQGWVNIEEMISKAASAADRHFTKEEMDFVVANNSKKRFEYSTDGLSIRASQGHSIDVDLGYEPAEPPSVLYHGTVAAVLEAINEQGLLKMDRHHVHLSADVETAMQVGGRRGKPVILDVDAAAMLADGHAFYISTNGVWLTAHVPPRYISAHE